MCTGRRRHLRGRWAKAPEQSPCSVGFAPSWLKAGAPTQALSHTAEPALSRPTHTPNLKAGAVFVVPHSQVRVEQPALCQLALAKLPPDPPHIGVSAVQGRLSHKRLKHWVGAVDDHMPVVTQHLREGGLERVGLRGLVKGWAWGACDGVCSPD